MSAATKRLVIVTLGTIIASVWLKYGVRDQDRNDRRKPAVVGRAESAKQRVEAGWKDAAPLTFWYVNHAGVGSVRRVIPLAAWFGSTEHHAAPCWLLRAFCLDRQALRDFDLGKVAPGRVSDG